MARDADADDDPRTYREYKAAKNPRIGTDPDAPRSPAEAPGTVVTGPDDLGPDTDDLAKSAGTDRPATTGSYNDLIDAALAEWQPGSSRSVEKGSIDVSWNPSGFDDHPHGSADASVTKDEAGETDALAERVAEFLNVPIEDVLAVFDQLKRADADGGTALDASAEATTTFEHLANALSEADGTDDAAGQAGADPGGGEASTPTRKRVEKSTASPARDVTLGSTDDGRAAVVTPGGEIPLDVLAGTGR